MLIRESGLAALIKQEWSAGYSVCLLESSVVLMGRDWFVEADRDALPPKVLGLIVQHMGMLPEDGAALKLCKDSEPQMLMQAAAIEEIDTWKYSEHAQPVKAIPLMWGKLQLFQGERDQHIVGTNRGLLRALDGENLGGIAMDEKKIVWTGDGEMVIVSTYRPEKLERWGVLESVPWSQPLHEE